MTTLMGPRLALRELSLGDADAVHAYLSNLEVIRSMTFSVHGRDDTRAYLEEAIADRRAEDGRAAVGWVLHPDHWGRG